VRPGLPCYGAILVGLIASATVVAQSVSFAVVSAASYQPGGAVAPDSLASLFGSNLAGSTASATLDQNGQLPTEMAGVSVEVNGEAAALLYVSPSQINFVVPADAALGAAKVVVQNTATSAQQSGTMLVANTAPAVFSADGTGKGPGAILNAVTNAPAPFLVETPEIAGSDQRTRLAVYATGLRYAGNPSHDPSMVNVAANVAARGQDAAGNSYTFTVEYAGPGPCCFGLDQVNIVLPAQLDGAGVVSLFLTAEGNTSNVVTFLMGSLPADSIRVAGLSFSPSYVNGGNDATLTISLNGVARSMGFPVSLQSSNSAAPVPYLMTVPAGQASTQVTIQTSPVTTVETVTITAQAAGATETTALEIDPANALEVSTLSVTPASVLGGQNVSATVTLSGTVPSGVVSVGISSDNSAAKPPATVSVPFAASTATFAIPTSTVAASQTCTITATLGRSSQTAQVKVILGLQLTLASSSVVGGNGNTVSGTVTIANSAPINGANIVLKSSDASATVPIGGVVIASGQTSASFTITTYAVTAERTVTITATYGSFTQTATLTVTPPALPTLTGLTVSPSYVSGGTNATGTVTLGAAAPALGINVTLQSSLPLTAQVPSLVTVPPGATTASFTISTTHVTSTQTVTMTAKAGGVTETAVLTVQ
jgi:uncharacterized protein (TIGR03437 family)